jgi:hypothetical protein
MARPAVSPSSLAGLLALLQLSSGAGESAPRRPPGAIPAAAPPPRFRALWNQPWTEQCQPIAPLPGGPVNISAFAGIETNADARAANGSVVAGPAFNGAVVATLYPQDGTGLYPYFDCSAAGSTFSEKTCKPVNGGSPQLANLTRHLAQWRADIARNFPDAGSTAVVALDWEEWWPVWENNEPDNNGTHYFVYGEVARRLARAASPQLPPAAVEAKAKAAWEAACQQWLTATMTLARTVRPHITWGFYNMPGATAEARPGAAVPAGNPSLDWLWSSVDALFPSIYLSQPDLPSNLAAVNRVLTEAKRVSALSSPPKPVFAYTMSEFDIGTELKFLDEASFQLEFNHSASEFSLSGLILYGGSADGSTPARCGAVRDYMTSTFLPAIAAIVQQRNG